MNKPIIEESVFVAEGAIVRGNVTVGENSGIWFGAVIRADNTSVTIGKNTNIQDNCVIHADKGVPASIGDNVTIGHGAIVHGCTICDNTLIGMGAIILNNAEIASNCIIGAGTLIPEGKKIPEGSLVLGVPGEIKRCLTPDEIRGIQENATHYVEEARTYKSC